MKLFPIYILLFFTFILNGCTAPNSSVSQTTKADNTLSNKEKAIALINSVDTGDKTALSYIHSNKFISHNLSIEDGLKGFLEEWKKAQKNDAKAQIIRIFQDGDYVFAQTKYDLDGPKIAFDIFRFKDGWIVEYWNNIEEVKPPNPSGRSQIDGPTSITDRDKTEDNKKMVKAFLTTILIDKELDKVDQYFDGNHYTQHNSAVADGLHSIKAVLEKFEEQGVEVRFKKIHKVLGEGNFVLTMNEGIFDGKTIAYFDLFRVENGKVAEHWDVIQNIPPKSKWKNDNGKF